ncbi:MAG: response regulator, partial [Massilibacteroides sp.]|nr:response regulator [Massilibacteroides sp.]
EWKHYLTDKKEKTSLPNNMVLSLCIDKNERLWVGTDGGLCYYDKANDCFINETLNIPSISICNIITYKDSLWLSTLNGFVCFSPTSKETKVFTTSDGLQNDQFTIQGSMLCSNGRMYLGTTHGFSIMSPQTYTSNNYVPPTWITNFQIFNKDIQTGKNNLLKKSIGYTDEIILNYRQNVLSIEYAALSYSAPGKNEYKFMLEGFDKEWNYVGNQNKATYTNLPAGKYIFRVMGSNNDGIWNDKETTLAIRVLPPFWRSTFAYIIYILLVTSLIFYVVYFFRKKAERKNKIRIRKIHAEKEKELYNAKINFFTQVAHEIRTPVSLIIGPLENIIEQGSELKPTIQEDLHIINKNSQRLLALVNQLLDFRKAEQGGFIPCFSKQNIYTLLQNTYDRFYPLIDKKGIVFEFKMKNKELEATLDIEAYTKIVSNLLTNASKYAQEHITMEVSNNENCFSLTISDDGEGIEENEFKNIFKPFYQIAGNNKPGTGIGLSLVKLLVEAHHGMIDVSCTQGKTSFIITLPIKQEKTKLRVFQPIVTPETNDCSPLVEEETTISTERPEAGKPTLLIVEDNIDLCNFLNNKLKVTYNILVAHNGKEGLEIMQKQTIEIIISDIMMPVMDGIEFCKEVKTNFLYSHIPVILLTAKTENTTKVESIKTGADAYIEKPFSFQLLQAQINNLLNSRKLLKKKFSEMPFMKLDSIAGNKADEVFLSKLNAIIEKNISNVEFSIDVLAEQLCISRSGLFAKIKTLTDMTPNELIHLVRLKKAAQLLATKEYRINEICYLVGFNNPSYFSKCFQKQFGVLPKDFTNKQSKNTMS